MSVTNAAAILKEANRILAEHLQENPSHNNDSPALRAYLKDTAFKPGDKWCLWFAEEVIWRAARASKIAFPNILRTGSCQELFDAAHHAGKIVYATQGVSTGSIGLVFGQNSSVMHHAIIVTGEDPQNPHRVTTIEGNSNENSSFDGYEVASRTRLKSTIAQVIF